MRRGEKNQELSGQRETDGGTMGDRGRQGDSGRPNGVIGRQMEIEGDRGGWRETEGERGRPNGGIGGLRGTEERHWKGWRSTKDLQSRQSQVVVSVSGHACQFPRRKRKKKEKK